MKNTKKGFTIVELVIVIAVIAILAAVLIPTFSSVTNSARESAAQQEAKAGLDSILALTSGSLPDGTTFAITNNTDNTVAYTFVYTGNKLTSKSLKEVTIEPYKTGTKPVYAIYVTASCWIKDNGGSVDASDDTATVHPGADEAAANKEKVEKLLQSVFELDKTPTDIGATKKVTIGESKNGSDYFTATCYSDAAGTTALDTFELRVYYTTDIQTTQVVFIGND